MAFDGRRGASPPFDRLDAEPTSRIGRPWDYSQDLRYTDIDVPLLLHLPTDVPASVARRPARYAHRVRRIPGTLLSRPRRSARLRHSSDSEADGRRFRVHAAIDSRGDRDDQRGLAYGGMSARPYRWIGALTTYGVLPPIWKSCGQTGGRSRRWDAPSHLSNDVSALRGRENPAFRAWTREGGGGPPCLWEFGGHGHPPLASTERRFLEANADCLGRQRRAETSRRAPGQRTEHEVAAHLSADIQTRAEMLDRRCGELPALSASTQEPGTLPACCRA